MFRKKRGLFGRVEKGRRRRTAGRERGGLLGEKDRENRGRGRVWGRGGRWGRGRAAGQTVLRTVSAGGARRPRRSRGGLRPGLAACRGRRRAAVAGGGRRRTAGRGKGKPAGRGRPAGRSGAAGAGGRRPPKPPQAVCPAGRVPGWRSGPGWAFAAEMAGLES